MTRNPAHDLGAALADALVAWQTLTPRDRRACRADALPRYEAAGWTTCDHPTCPPWDCRPDLFDTETYEQQAERLCTSLDLCPECCSTDYLWTGTRGASITYVCRYCGRPASTLADR